MLFDSHCHFKTADDLSGILSRAKGAGVGTILAMGCDTETNAGAIAAWKRDPSSVRLALGFDYSSAENRPDFISALSPHRHALSCIGEIGMDAHYGDNLPRQAELFSAQLALADEWNLPVSVHTRECDAETLAAIDSVPQKNRKGLRGVIHCYTGGADFAHELLARNFALGFSGIVTFRNADPLREVARIVPEDRILIETDSPYLAPVPLRGKRNEPAFVAHVCECLARVRGISLECMAALTTANAKAVFGN